MTNHGFHINIILCRLRGMSPQHPPNPAHQVAVSRITAPHWLTLPEQLPKTPVLSLQLLQPVQRLGPIHPAKRCLGLILPIGGRRKCDEREIGCRQVRLALEAVLPVKAVRGTAAEATLGVLQAEDPGADAGPLLGAEGRGEDVEGGDHEACPHEAG